MNWTIKPVLSGEFGFVRDDIKYVGGDPSIRSMVPSYIFAMKSEVGTVLVDTSFGDPKVCSEKMNLVVKRKKDFIDILFDNGIVPEKVRGIIITHLHWDHADNLHYFPNSTIFCQKQEIESVFRSDIPHYLESFNTRINDVHVLEGNAEIYPGLRVFLTGGHTVGLQMVEAETKHGKALLPSDNIMVFENLIKNIPVGLCINGEECSKSLSWVRENYTVVYPSHDYNTLKGNTYEIR